MIDGFAKGGDHEGTVAWDTQMIQSGVTPGTHNFLTVVTACARAGRADIAEAWIRRMEDAGLSPDVIVYSSAIDACSKAGDPERGMRIFEKMAAQGIKANVVAYSSLARPFAKLGDWETVERLGRQMEGEGIRMNEYFLYALLDAYTSAKPRQFQRGERAFREAMNKQVDASQHVITALNRLLGRPRARTLLEQHSIRASK